MQNKLHWAITGHTAAEIIAERANASRPNMGLTSWKGARVRKGDVTVAKNYLDETEISQLNRIITMFLDYAEMQAERKRPVYMNEWKEKLDNFLKFNEREILEDAGKVSMDVAQHLALEEYETFSRQRIIKDTAVSEREFENLSKKIEDKKRGMGKTRD